MTNPSCVVAHVRALACTLLWAAAAAQEPASAPQFIPDTGVSIDVNRKDASLIYQAARQTLVFPGSQLTICDARNGGFIRALDLESEAELIATIPSSDEIYLYSESHHLLRINVARGTVSRDVRLGTTHVNAIFGIDGKRVALGNTDYICVWDVESRTLLQVLGNEIPRDDNVIDYAYQPSVRRLAALDSSERRVRLFDLDQMVAVATVPVSPEVLTETPWESLSLVALSEEGALAVTSEKGRILASPAGGPLAEISAEKDRRGKVVALAVRGKAQTIAALTEAGQLLLFAGAAGEAPRLVAEWTLQTGYLVETARAGAEPEDAEKTELDADRSKLWFPDNRTLAAMVNGTYFKLNLDDLRIELQHRVEAAGGTSIGLLAAGASLLQLDLTGQTNVWDLKRGWTFPLTWNARRFFSDGWFYFNPVAADEAGDRLYLAEPDGTLRIHSLANPGFPPRIFRLRSLLGPDFKFSALTAMPDGSIYCSDDGGGLHLIDLQNVAAPRLLASAKVVKSPGALYVLRASRDGRVVIGKDDFGLPYVLHYREGALRLSYHNPERQAESDFVGIAISSDGQWAVHARTLLDLRGPVVHTRLLETLGGGPCHFEPADGRFFSISSASEDAEQTVLVTDPLGGSPAGAPKPSPLVGAPAHDLALLAPGLIALQRDARIELRRLESGQLIAELFAFPEGQWCVTDRSGRFDASFLDDFSRAHWIFPDDPFRSR